MYLESKWAYKSSFGLVNFQFFHSQCWASKLPAGRERPVILFSALLRQPEYQASSYCMLLMKKHLHGSARNPWSIDIKVPRNEHSINLCEMALSWLDFSSGLVLY